MPWLLLHMDGQLGNVRTDVSGPISATLGLAISPRFDLSAAELDFAEHIVVQANRTLQHLRNSGSPRRPHSVELAPVAEMDCVER